MDRAPVTAVPKISKAWMTGDSKQSKKILHEMTQRRHRRRSGFETEKCLEPVHCGGTLNKNLLPLKGSLLNDSFRTIRNFQEFFRIL